MQYLIVLCSYHDCTRILYSAALQGLEYFPLKPRYTSFLVFPNMIWCWWNDIYFYLHSLINSLYKLIFYHALHNFSIEILQSLQGCYIVLHCKYLRFWFFSTQKPCYTYFLVLTGMSWHLCSLFKSLNKLICIMPCTSQFNHYLNLNPSVAGGIGNWIRWRWWSCVHRRSFHCPSHCIGVVQPSSDKW